MLESLHAAKRIGIEDVFIQDFFRHERSVGGLNNASQFFSRPSGEVLPPGLLDPELAERSGPREKERGKLGRESGSSVAEDP